MWGGLLLAIRKPIGKWENHRKTHRKMEIFPLVNVYIPNWKITILLK
jgi:hypothetical protein